MLLCRTIKRRTRRYLTCTNEEMNKKNIVELVDRALKKDNLAMETLYNSFYKDVLYVCKKLNLNDADAYDIAQDTFIDAFSKLDTLSDKSKFKMWIIRIANNKALNLLKHNNVIKFENIDDDNSFTEIPGKAKNIEDQYIDNEVASILKSIIEKLPLEQKITVFMYYYEDMPVKEIAAAYNCSENTVRSRLNYAKKFITSEVNKLENNNVKLRCSAIIPFLFILFANESEAFAASIPESSIPSSTGVIAKAMKSLKGKTIKTFSIGKIVGISTAAIAVISGAVIGIISLGGKDDNNDVPNQYVASSDPTVNTSDNDDSDKKETETSKKETYDTGDEYWDYYPIDSFNMPEIEYTTIDYAGGVLTANIADTFFSLSENDIIESIKNNDLHNGHEHEFGTRFIEECSIKNFTDIGTQKRYTGTKIVYAYDKAKQDSYSDEDFMYDYIVSMTTDYANYNSPNTIEVSIYNVNVNRDFQKKAFNLLESIFGNEIANYLTYAKDADGKDKTGSAYNSTMYDVIKIGTTYYKLQRSITSGGENNDSIKFEVTVSHKNEKSSSSDQSYYNANYTSILTPDIFSFEDFILGNFGSTNINEISTFGAEYMKHGLDEIYNKTQSEGYLFIVNNYPDGSTSNEFTMTTIKHCENYSNIFTPELDISIMNIMKDGELISLETKFQGEIGIAEPPSEGTVDYAPLYQPFLNKVKAILGEDVDLSEITMEKFLSQTGISFDATYLGKPCNVTLDYSQYVNMAPLMSGDFEITITMCE